MDGAESEDVGPLSLDAHTLGAFRVFANDRPVVNWPNGRSKAVLKYLVTHRQRPVPRDVLMDLFWPAAGPDAARNSLNVAIYGLRKALSSVQSGVSYILFRDGCYRFNPELRIWVDAEAFMHQFSLAKELDRKGSDEEALRAYKAAEILYQGDFLSEDRYEDWLVPLRQRLCDDYVAVLARLSRFCFGRGDFEPCVRLCERMLAIDSCNEEAYRCVMRCYIRLGQPHLAVRQYHACVANLSRELRLMPARETSELFATIRRGERL
jgi:DNA-binding SARP family transcriptional activator